MGHCYVHFAFLFTLTSEYLLHAHESIVALLQALFHMIFVHCYVPGALTEVMIIPLVKNKNKDITDKNNYRPIAIANVVSKVLERIILMRIQHVVTICDNQFGRKHNLQIWLFTL